MSENKFNIIFKKLEELSNEKNGQDNFGENRSETSQELNEISELCRLSIETKEENIYLFTTT
ncbi:MAG: hypothetical protein JXA06_06665 [Bacteroidetes bacterium]|nr:hypothetical protein [Bacteroidota bacterium]